MNNVIEITRNAEYCLVYDRPLEPNGLSWRSLVSWWRDKDALEAADELECGRKLYRRLMQSLASPPEQLFFERYCTLYGHADGFELPALIPQVYLHYDPYSKNRRYGSALVRQRMDFLLLLPNRARVVIEIDGDHHYSTNGRPDRRKYSEMVSEDRTLRLAGYDIYRFGGYAVDLIRRLITGESQRSAELDESYATFLRQSFPEIEGRFSSKEAFEETKSSLSKLKKLRAQEMFG